jgi:hypothetical protein
MNSLQLDQLRIFLTAFTAIVSVATARSDVATVVGSSAPAKPRGLALTGIANEPDDEESLVRRLVYSSEYDNLAIAVKLRHCGVVKSPRDSRRMFHVGSSCCLR